MKFCLFLDLDFKVAILKLKSQVFCKLETEAFHEQSINSDNIVLKIPPLHLLFALLSLGCWTNARAQDLKFTNVTTEAGIDHVHGYQTNLITAVLRVTAGMAVGDYDKDGFPDLYFERGDIGPNLLYRNLGNGRFAEVAQAAGLDLPNYLGAGPLFADYDGDGWDDLLLGGLNGNPVRLFRNQKNGRFEDVTSTSGIDLTEATYSFAVADYNRDGQLDLYLSHWLERRSRSCIWKNLGNGRFENADFALGFYIYNPFYDLNYAFNGNFSDVNDDGYPDLLISSDFFTSQIWLNRGGESFERQRNLRLTDENGMGSCVGDYDNDGDLDWFVTSIYDYDGVSEGNWGSRGNRLYENRGNGLFEDVSEAAGVRNGGWGWGASFADLNNDGYLDIVHTNGWPNGNGQFGRDSVRVFLSNQNGTFTDVAALTGLVDSVEGRGLSVLDYDRDGDLDIAIANYRTAPGLWRNDYRGDNHYLTIKPDVPTAQLIGTKIWVHIGNQRQLREIRAGSNYNGQNLPEAHFGLGEARVVDSVVISWVNGGRQVLYNVAADQLLEVTAIDPGLANGEWSASPNPFTNNVFFQGKLASAADPTIQVFDATGRLLTELTGADTYPENGWSLRWNTANADRTLPTGVYYARLLLNGKTTDTIKLLKAE